MSSTLANVRNELLHLHQTLIAAERLQHERAFGRVTSSGQLLELVTQGEAFAWLRPFSQLIARLDAQLEEPALAVERVVDLLDELAGLMSSARYLETLQNIPEVVIAHGRVHHALRGARLPLAA